MPPMTELLESAKRLKNAVQFKNAFICPDKTSEERERRREAVALKRKKSMKEPGKRFFITKGKEVSE